MMTAVQAAELAEKNRQSIVNDIIVEYRIEIENKIKKACSEGKRYCQYCGDMPDKVLKSLTEQGYLITCRYDYYEISW